MDDQSGRAGNLPQSWLNAATGGSDPNLANAALLHDAVEAQDARQLRAQ